ncbi:sel1 repeat family protein [Acidobacteria bacterium AB60]|nr:sel1 repeat family protein [Acidobacteria bacterium AB60]
MDEQLIKRLMQESERLNADEQSEWSSLEALWMPHVAKGNIEAQFRLAYYYLFGSFEEGSQKRAEMEGLLRGAAERNHPDATNWLSHLYGEGAERDALLLRAGELGSLAAQRDLGALYATGDWTGPHDAVRGAEWYRVAAERGHAEAQYSLGFMYLRGEGVQADPIKGLEWLRQSAGQGDESAIRLLADVYRDGTFGIPVDAAEAHLWREKYQATELYRLRKQRWGAEGA